MVLPRIGVKMGHVSVDIPAVEQDIQGDRAESLKDLNSALDVLWTTALPRSREPGSADEMIKMSQRQKWNWQVWGMLGLVHQARGRLEARMGQDQQAKADDEESEEVIRDLERQMDDVRREWDEALADLADRVADMPRQIDQVQIKPKRSDIDVTVFGVGWVPSWRIVHQEGSGAVETVMLPAYRGGQTQPRS